MENEIVFPQSRSQCCTEAYKAVINQSETFQWKIKLQNV